jgi:hypothetical protein
MTLVTRIAAGALLAVLVGQSRANEPIELQWGVKIPLQDGVKLNATECNDQPGLPRTLSQTGPPSRRRDSAGPSMQRNYNSGGVVANESAGMRAP